MEQWLCNTFPIELIDGKKWVMVCESPEVWAPLDWIVSMFSVTELPPSRDVLRTMEGETGWGYIFDNWQARGLIN